jgi:hypothetical protein
LWIKRPGLTAEIKLPPLIRRANKQSTAFKASGQAKRRHQAYQYADAYSNELIVCHGASLQLKLCKDNHPNLLYKPTAQLAAGVLSVKLWNSAYCLLLYGAYGRRKSFFGYVIWNSWYKVDSTNTQQATLR